MLVAHLKANFLQRMNVLPFCSKQCQKKQSMQQKYVPFVFKQPNTVFPRRHETTGIQRYDNNKIHSNTTLSIKARAKLSNFAVGNLARYRINSKTRKH